MSEVGSNGRLKEHVEDSLRRQAQRDIDEFVRNNAQSGRVNMATLYSTVLDSTQVNQIYTDGTGTWQNITVSYNGNEDNISWASVSPVIKIKVGRHILKIRKEQDSAGEIEITPEDIEKAKIEYIKGMQINIITRRAETKAESLLKMFISEIDFKNFKEKGYFTVKSGDKVYRIWRDNHRWVDKWEKKDGVFQPKNRLCTHTERRELPLADEALQKLMLIRSNRIEEFSNAHSLNGVQQGCAEEMKPIREEELVLV
jgi:hypothetical protein